MLGWCGHSSKCLRELVFEIEAMPFLGDVLL